MTCKTNTTEMQQTQMQWAAAKMQPTQQQHQQQPLPAAGGTQATKAT
jgi:hypothetical protein